MDNITSGAENAVEPRQDFAVSASCFSSHDVVDHLEIIPTPPLSPWERWNNIEIEKILDYTKTGTAAHGMGRGSITNALLQDASTNCFMHYYNKYQPT